MDDKRKRYNPSETATEDESIDYVRNTCAASPRSPRSPAKSERVHPCSQEEFDGLDDGSVDATEDIPNGSDGKIARSADHRASLTGNGRKSILAGVVHYSNPNASDAPVVIDNDMATREKIEAAGGLVYLVFTIVLSIVYLATLTPTMANDLWWVGFNATGAQSYLIDLINMQLNLRANGSLDLTANRYGIAKDYSNFYTPLQVSTTYTRSVVTEYTHDLRGIIPSLMLYTTPTNVQTQFCWVDFNRTWEVAHTDARQARCYARYKDNG
ncbi:hypothetical protein As57867_010131, partial [Aphanomyces stellatus]